MVRLFSSGMIRQGHPTYKQYVLACGGILIPVALFPAHNIAYNTFYLMILAGFLGFLSDRRCRFDGDDKRIGTALLLLVVTAWLSYACNGFAPESWDKLQVAFGPLLGLPPVYLLFRRVGNAPAIMRWVVTAGALWCGVLALKDVADQAPAGQFLPTLGLFLEGSYRAGGGGNPVVFGGVSAILTLVTVSGWTFFVGRGGTRLLIWLSAIAMGLSALILSGSRGAWLTLPAMFVGFLFLRWKLFTATQRRILMGCGLLGMALLAMIPAVQIRFDTSLAELSKYLTRAAGEPVTGSVGLRLETWRIALGIFLERPLFGYGPGQWHDAFLAAKGSALTANAPELAHPHNLFISALLLRGVAGLFAELLFWGGILYAFARRAASADCRVAGAGLAGAFVSGGVMVLGLTDMPMDWGRRGVILYSFLLVGWWAAVREAEQKTMPLRNAG